MAEEKKNRRYVFFAELYTFVINRDKFRTAYKLLIIEKVDLFFNFQFIRMLISEESQQPFRVLRKRKNVVFRIKQWTIMIVCLPCFSLDRIDLKLNLGNSEKLKFSPDCEQLI